MWAFVILDRKRRRLFASRDRFGKKPLYYFHEGGTFGFASELPALRQHPACPRSLSELSLQKYFAYGYMPAPRSIYERVWKLPGGHSCSFDLATRELRVWRYWEFVLEPDERSRTVDGAGRGNPRHAGARGPAPAHVRCAARRLSQRRHRFLGRRRARRAARPAGELNTFAIGFDDPSFDESAYARTRGAAARHAPPRGNARSGQIARAAAGDRRPARRAARRRLAASHLPALPLHPPARHRRARRRWRRRALRRLRSLPRAARCRALRAPRAAPGARGGAPARARGCR